MFRSQRQTKGHAWILRDVSFEIEYGQTVGIIGRNGTGKSTLLKLISQIIRPTTGRIAIEGRISSLLELGAGFHPDLSGRENIYLYGAILGLDRRRIRRQFDEIVDFAEMGAFIDMPIRHYSSGMQLRLAFSTAIHVEPDILLVDEALAVGDHFFQQRSLERIAQLIESGITVVLVSHDLDVIRQHCQRIIWLDGGTIKADGEAEWAISCYLDSLYNTSAATSPEAVLPERLASVDEIEAAKRNGTSVKRWGSGEIEITDVEFLNQVGTNQRVFHTGQPLIARMHYTARGRVAQPVFGAAIYRNDGLHVNGPNTKMANFSIPQVEGRGYIDYHVEQLNLLPGTYDFSAVVYDLSGTHAYDHQHRLYNFVVRGGEVKEVFGAFYLPSRWQHHPTPPSEALEAASSLSQVKSDV
ncbi:MAG: ABC transporter ATP-binding protein [Anaerolineae bacterium]|nr:ABC transporter ATP-binding protein [Anaerolineae bacterium]